MRLVEERTCDGVFVFRFLFRLLDRRCVQSVMKLTELGSFWHANFSIQYLFGETFSPKYSSFARNLGVMIPPSKLMPNANPLVWAKLEVLATPLLLK